MSYVIDFITLTWVCDHCGTRNATRYRYAWRENLHEHCNGIGCPVHLGWSRARDCHRQMYVPNLDEHQRKLRRAAKLAVQAEHREIAKEQRAEQRLIAYLNRKYGYPLEA